MVLDGGETASESCVDVLDATGYDSSGLTNKGSYISTTRNGFSKILLNNGWGKIIISRINITFGDMGLYAGYLHIDFSSEIAKISWPF